MKRLILACGLLGAIATAQAHPENQGRPLLDTQQHAERLQKSLQLSDEQAAKVKKILESSDQQRKALKEKYRPQFEAFHADAKALREQTNTQIDGVLTPKQKEAFKEQNKTREGIVNRMHRPGTSDDDGPAAPPADRPE